MKCLDMLLGYIIYIIYKYVRSYYGGDWSNNIWRVILNIWLHITIKIVFFFISVYHWRRSLALWVSHEFCDALDAL